MSSNARRREKELEWEAQQARNDAECRRKAALSLYDRVQESDASEDVKEILLELAELCKLDVHASKR